jgi:4-hydroxybenzoyl-CoA reductase subunit beta
MERLTPFTLHRPASLAEAVALLAREPSARAIAGGTDLVPNLRDGLGAPAALVDLTAIAGLDAIEVAADGNATIGAAVTLARLARDEALAGVLPVLREAALVIAGPGHRTLASVGGNLCLDTRCVYYNQSAWWRRANDYCLKHGGETCHVAPQGKRCHAAFAGDLAPALIALGAEVDVVGPEGARRLPLEDLYADDGAAHLALARGELLAGVRVAAQPPGARSAYRKARARGAIDFPLAGVAVRLALAGGRIADLRVALTGTNSRPLRVAGAEAWIGAAPDETLFAAVAKAVQKQVSPMRTTLTSSYWRRSVAGVLARRLVAELAARDGVASDGGAADG